MKLAVILTITVKDEQTKEELIKFVAEYIQYVKIVYKDNKYDIIRLGAGIHTNASRLHCHIAIIAEIPQCEDVKHWNKKLTSMIKMDNPSYELRRTPYRDTDPKYNEDSAISYLFKEYESDSQVVLTDSFIGIDNWPELRQSGHNLYIKAQAEHERTALRKKQEEDENENIVQFVRDFIHPKNRKTSTEWGQFHTHPFSTRYKIVKVAILTYYQQRYNDTGRRGFKAYSVRDKAISFLTTENLCSLSDLADFLN